MKSHYTDGEILLMHSGTGYSDQIVWALAEEVTYLRDRLSALAAPAGVNSPIDPRHFDILAEAMAEVKATSDGLSDQPIADIVAGCIEEIAALPDALAAPSIEPVGVKVKPLEWKRNGREVNSLWAECDPINRYYTIEPTSNVFEVETTLHLSEFGSDKLGLHPTLEAAKAAAQADYEARIIGALTAIPTPSPEEDLAAAVEAELVAVLEELDRHTCQGSKENCHKCGFNWRDTRHHLTANDSPDPRRRIELRLLAIRSERTRKGGAA